MVAAETLVQNCAFPSVLHCDGIRNQDDHCYRWMSPINVVVQLSARVELLYL
jgi:hypothetical protein